MVTGCQIEANNSQLEQNKQGFRLIPGGLRTIAPIKGIWNSRAKYLVIWPWQRRRLNCGGQRGQPHAKL